MNNLDLAFLAIMQTNSILLQQMECKTIDDLDNKIHQLRLQIASLEDQGLNSTSSRQLLADCLKAKDEYLSAKRKYDKERKQKEIRWTITFCIVAVLVFIIFIIALTSSSQKIENNYNTEHARGEFQCPNCGSYETDGFYVFWCDGIPCNGDREYNLAHADYSIFSCDHCGQNFNVTRNQWQKHFNKE